MIDLDAVKAKLALYVESRERVVAQMHVHDGAIQAIRDLIAEAEKPPEPEPEPPAANEP